VIANRSLLGGENISQAVGLPCVNRLLSEGSADAGALAQDRAAFDAVQVAHPTGIIADAFHASTCLRRHLLHKIADGAVPLSGLSNERSLIRRPHVDAGHVLDLVLGGCALGKPPPNSVAEMLLPARGDVHEAVQMFAGAVFRAFPRPRDQQRKAMLASVLVELLPQPLKEAAAVDAFHSVNPDWSERDEPVQRLPGLDGMMPRRHQELDLMVGQRPIDCALVQYLDSRREDDPLTVCAAMAGSGLDRKGIATISMRKLASRPPARGLEVLNKS
jgi:hypothetical protein